MGKVLKIIQCVVFRYPFGRLLLLQVPYWKIQDWLNARKFSDGAMVQQFSQMHRNRWCNGRCMYLDLPAWHSADVLLLPSIGSSNTYKDSTIFGFVKIFSV